MYAKKNKCSETIFINTIKAKMNKKKKKRKELKKKKKKKKIGVFRYFSYIPNLTPGDRLIAVRWKNR